MKELIKALHVIQDECKKHQKGNGCIDCPMSYDDGAIVCCVSDLDPHNWKINDEVQKALL